MAKTSLIMALPDPILVVRRDGLIVDSIGGKTFTMDLEPDAIVGETIEDALPKSFADRLKFLIPRVLRGRDAANDTVHEAGRRFELRVSVHGRERVLVVLRELGGGNASVEGTAAYIDEDIVTGLIERQRALALLDDSITGAKLAERPLTIFCCGIRNYEDCCAGFGQAMADAMQRVAAQRLQRACEVSLDDTLLRVDGRPLLTRVSDGSYLFALRESDSQDLVERVTAVLRAAFAEPLSLADTLVEVRLNIGCASLPRDGETAGDLLRDAMAAMREAGRLDRTMISRFGDAANSRAMGAEDLGTELRWALDKGQFELHYQPVFNLSDATPVAIEAFLRWQHPLRGVIPAADFMPYASAAGIASDIDDWVLRTACTDVNAVREANDLPLAVTVNLSSDWITRDALIENLRALFDEIEFEPARLQLDLTERMLMRSANAGPLIAHLKAMQVGIQIDDFGCGYTSLSELRRLPLDALKIGGSFTNRIGAATEDEALCRSVIALAHAYGMRCIAEAVERQDQVQFLREAGCDEVQGVLFGEPMVFDELLVFLQQFTLGMSQRSG
ncbi:MAG: GGDEF domain-containing phosphodiesterase [Pseudomonadota bacterium]